MSTISHSALDMSRKKMTLREGGGNVPRSKAVTEAYVEIRRVLAINKEAEAFAKICESIPMKIYSDELFVGSSGAYRSAEIGPDVSLTVN